MEEIKALNKLPNDWYFELKRNGIYPDLYEPINNLLSFHKEGKEIFPDFKNIYKAFKLCSYSDTKVVIFGQDPYHQPGLANGLAFAVNNGTKIPASLKNIYKEIVNDTGNCIYSSGNLEEWATQGVLLLNNSLTVNKSEAGSHKYIGWNILIKSIIELLNIKGGVIFLLWGKEAQENEKFINMEVNYVFKSPHPSPLSSHRGFIGCKHFSSTNKLLIKNKKEPILW
jgi:uracil-DNA glycosylase